MPNAHLTLLHKPENGVHKHIIIAVSGFLSEKADHGSDWAHLKDYCQKFDYPLFGVGWESSTVADIGSAALKNFKESLVDTGASQIASKSLFGGLGK